MGVLKKKIVMPVYNEIDYDGRVQRAAEALSETYHVTVFSINSGNGYSHEKFSTEVVTLPHFKRFKLLRHLWFWIKLWRLSLRLSPFIVYAHDFYMALPGLIAARLGKAKLIYDAHELIIPDQDTPSTGRESFFYRVEYLAVRWANLIICANTERAEIMKRHYDLKSMPVVVSNIPRTPKTVFTFAGLVKQYPQLLRRRENITRIVYQGDINLERGLGPFITAMTRLSDQFELLFVGGGRHEHELRRKALALGLEDRVSYLGRVPCEHLHDILRMCDIGIISYASRGMNNLYCAPNKLYEYLQAGLTIVSTCQPTLRSFIDHYQIGIVVGCDTASEEGLAAEIAHAVEHLTDSSEAYRNNIPTFMHEHNWESEQQCLLDAVAKL